mmetsp:Transcript_4138/g.7386  ORF Transcript_4138/g.7386 Transcript_4138/m.7386 type:complete len:206 (-) Transcript_4138:192-809(-)
MGQLRRNRWPTGHRIWAVHATKVDSLEWRRENKLSFRLQESLQQSRVARSFVVVRSDERGRRSKIHAAVSDLWRKQAHFDGFLCIFLEDRSTEFGAIFVHLIWIDDFKLVVHVPMKLVVQKPLRAVKRRDADGASCQFHSEFGRILHCRVKFFFEDDDVVVLVRTTRHECVNNQGVLILQKILHGNNRLFLVHFGQMVGGQNNKN